MTVANLQFNQKKLSMVFCVNGKKKKKKKKKKKIPENACKASIAKTE